VVHTKPHTTNLTRSSTTHNARPTRFRPTILRTTLRIIRTLLSPRSHTKVHRQSEAMDQCPAEACIDLTCQRTITIIHTWRRPDRDTRVNSSRRYLFLRHTTSRSPTTMASSVNRSMLYLRWDMGQDQEWVRQGWMLCHHSPGKDHPRHCLRIHPHPETQLRLRSWLTQP
jgi:hypothetical protein